MSKYLLHCIEEQDEERKRTSDNEEAYRIYKRLENTTHVFSEKFLPRENVPKIMKQVAFFSL